MLKTEPLWAFGRGVIPSPLRDPKGVTCPIPPPSFYASDGNLTFEGPSEYELGKFDENQARG